MWKVSPGLTGKALCPMSSIVCCISLAICQKIKTRDTFIIILALGKLNQMFTENSSYQDCFFSWKLILHSLKLFLLYWHVWTTSQSKNAWCVQHERNEMKSCSPQQNETLMYKVQYCSLKLFFYKHRYYGKSKALGSHLILYVGHPSYQFKNSFLYSFLETWITLWRTYYY